MEIIIYWRMIIFMEMMITICWPRNNTSPDYASVHVKSTLTSLRTAIHTIGHYYSQYHHWPLFSTSLTTTIPSTSDGNWPTGQLVLAPGRQCSTVNHLGHLVVVLNGPIPSYILFPSIWFHYIRVLFYTTVCIQLP